MSELKAVLKYTGVQVENHKAKKNYGMYMVSRMSGLYDKSVMDRFHCQFFQKHKV